MKNDRQNKILEIITNENIETQEQLLERLQDYGITSTQATISRGTVSNNRPETFFPAQRPCLQ